MGASITGGLLFLLVTRDGNTNKGRNHQEMGMPTKGGFLFLLVTRNGNTNKGRVPKKTV